MGLEKRCRLVFGAALAVTVVLVIYYGYYKCSGVNQLECSLFTTSRPHVQQQLVGKVTFRDGNLHTYTASKVKGSVSTVVENETDDVFHFNEADLYREYDLDLEQEDVLVFLHIQKTGGTTFGRQLVKNLDVRPPCKCYHGHKKCDCFTKGKKIWLFSRFSTGWICGLHADWTELMSCVDSAMDNKLEKIHRKRKYHFITLLRQPVYRYISEWKHVQRGATWKTARLQCRGRKATLQEVPFCYDGEDWSGVQLKEFMECPHNLATNRQTRMMADLSLVNCYNHSTIPQQRYKSILLESAKENLKNMAFIGLLEYQNYTQWLFEHTFNLKFIDDFEQYNKTHTGKASKKITADQFRRVQELNELDVKLYQFAKELFFQRLSAMQAETNDSNLSSIDLMKAADEDSVEDYEDYEEEEDLEDFPKDEDNSLESFLKDMRAS